MSDLIMYSLIRMEKLNQPLNIHGQDKFQVIKSFSSINRNVIWHLNK